VPTADRGGDSAIKLFPAEIPPHKRTLLLGDARCSAAALAEAGALREDEGRRLTPLTELPGSRRSREVRAELVKRVNGVLSIARMHVERLDDYADHWADEADPFVTLADKLAIEASLLALITSRNAAAGSSIARAAGDLAEALESRVRSPRNRALLLRFPHTAMSLGIGHVALTALGNEDPLFDRLLRAAIESGHADSIERLPYRAMERRWLAGLLTATPPRFDDLLRQSVAASEPHPIYMLATDVYALTHAPMFVTDFGVRKPPRAVRLEAFDSALDASLAWTLFTDNFDLMAELVLARLLLRLPWSRAQALAWYVLDRIWVEAGALPSPGFVPSEIALLTGTERLARITQQAYHTTYVAGMLCSVLLRTPVPPEIAPVRTSSAANAELAAQAEAAAAKAGLVGNERQSTETGVGAKPALAAAARSLSERHDLGRAWEFALDAPAFDERDAPSVLGDGLLTAAARRYDLVLLGTTLCLVASYGLPLTSTVVEATRFLMRQQMPSGSIGGWFVAEDVEPGLTDPHGTAALAQPLLDVAARVRASTTRNPEAAGPEAHIGTYGGEGGI
jgi:Domain of unknown function (DUF6895)